MIKSLKEWLTATICLFIYLFVCLFVCLFIYLFIDLLIYLFSCSRRFLANVLRTSSTNYLTNMSQVFHDLCIKERKWVHATKNERTCHLINLHHLKLNKHHSRLHLGRQHFPPPGPPVEVVPPALSYPCLRNRHKQVSGWLRTFLYKCVVFQTRVE